MPARRPFSGGPELAMTTNALPLLLLASTAIGGRSLYPRRADTKRPAPAVPDDGIPAAARRLPPPRTPSRAHPARCRDDGGDPHPAPARRRAGHRLGDHHRGHRSREHAGRARPGAQRARRHGRQQPVPRRLPELRDPRHRRQPRAPDHVDGMRMPDFPDCNVGAGTYTRELPDLENVKRVEIIRGPASALYGSDAIGGVVAYTTKDPGDYLIGGKQHLRQRQGRLQRRQPAVRRDASPAPSARQRRVSRHLHAARRPRIPSGAVLARTPIRRAWLQQRLPGQARVSADRDRHDPHHRRLHPGPAEHEILSSVGDFPQPVRPDLRRMGPRHTQTYRISAQWVHDAPIGFIDRIDFLAYFNSVYTQEDTYQLRGGINGAIPTNGRTSQFYFTQNVSGAELQMNTDAKLFDLRNVFTYGLCFAYTTTTRPARPLADHAGAAGHEPRWWRARSSPTRTSPIPRPIQAGVYRAGRDHGPGRQAHPHAGGTARLLQAQPQSRPILLELDGRHAERGAERQHLCVGFTQVRRDLPLLGHLFVLLPVRDWLPRAALRQRQLRLHQHRLVLPDPAQRQPEARDGQQLRGRLPRQVCGRLELAAHRLLQPLQQLPRDGDGGPGRPDHPVPVRQPHQRHDLGRRGARRVPLHAGMVGAGLDRLRPGHRHAHRRCRSTR